jgi:glutaredoxin
MLAETKDKRSDAMNIVVYTRRACAFSQSLTSFLNALGVAHRTVNIDRDATAMRLIRAVGEREETPFVDFGDGQIVKMPDNHEVLSRLLRGQELPPVKAA